MCRISTFLTGALLLASTLATAQQQLFTDSTTAYAWEVPPFDELHREAMSLSLYSSGAISIARTVRGSSGFYSTGFGVTPNSAIRPDKIGSNPLLSLSGGIQIGPALSVGLQASGILALNRSTEAGNRGVAPGLYMGIGPTIVVSLTKRSCFQVSQNSMLGIGMGLTLFM